jgi:hypothetical protein
MPSRIVTYALCDTALTAQECAVNGADQPGVVAERRCAKCGGPLASQRDDARYCSSPCRQAAYRQRRDHPGAAS